MLRIIDAVLSEVRWIKKAVIFHSQEALDKYVKDHPRTGIFGTIERYVRYYKK